MDKVLEKFGIYDFMGIWGPGALTVTYYFFTLRPFFLSAFEKVGISKGILTSNQIVWILYTAVAYVIGVILHELGKLITDSIPIFDIRGFTNRISDFKKQISKNKRDKKCLFKPFKNIKIEVLSAFDQNNIPYNRNNIEGFEKALNDLKYNNNVNTRRIDTYHSVYALSRSLLLCFAINFVLLIIDCSFTERLLNWPIITTDVLLCILFFIRAYRYFHSWVKNVYVQYYYEIRERR